jgi:hypothetical protein
VLLGCSSPVDLNGLTWRVSSWFYKASLDTSDRDRHAIDFYKGFKNVDWLSRGTEINVVQVNTPSGHNELIGALPVCLHKEPMPSGEIARRHEFHEQRNVPPTFRHPLGHQMLMIIRMSNRILDVVAPNTETIE